jgi:hypothetical protein
MPYAELRQQSVDSSQLNARATARVPQLCGLDVILPVRTDEWQGRKALDEILARTRAGETLKQLLQDKPGGHDNFFARECGAQGVHLSDGSILVAPESERPNAGVDEQRHRRDRSAL